MHVNCQNSYYPWGAHPLTLSILKTIMSAYNAKIPRNGGLFCWLVFVYEERTFLGGDYLDLCFNPIY
jgi:hypothetical protein